MPILGDLDITPPTNPPPPQVFVDWGGVTVRYRGWDGSEWKLSGLEDGVSLVRGGVRGLTMPPITRFTTSSPAVAGSRYTGHQVTEREVFWPVMVYSNAGSQAWMTVERAWWKTMRPDRVGTWSITDRLGHTRSLDVRFLDDGDQSFDSDPTMSGWSIYAIHLIAESPFWRGDGVHREWGVIDDTVFFSSNPATVVNIADGSSVDTATMTNPGDVDAWMQWGVNGPVEGAVLGTSNGYVSFDFALDEGEWVQIDTRPERMTAIDNTGDDRSAEIIWNPAPLPPGEEQRLEITLTAALAGASVVGDLEDLYYRAWG